MFIDDLIADGKASRENLPGHVVFDMRNVFDALPDFGWYKPMDKLFSSTSIRPPYPLTWLEFLNVDEHQRDRYGCSAREMTFDQLRQTLQRVPEPQRRGTVELIDRFIADGAASMVSFSWYYGQAGRTWPLIRVLLPVDEKFVMLPIDFENPANDKGGFLYMHQAGEMPGQDDTVYVQQTFYGAYFLAVLHVRNIVLDDHAPDPAVQRARVRRHKQPLMHFKTLRVVTPGSVRTAQEPRELGEPQEIAFHIVRGYWAHYSDDRPLFGRPGLSGTFWIPSHARGRSDAGVVVKDYAVVRKEEAEPVAAEE